MIHMGTNPLIRLVDQKVLWSMEVDDWLTKIGICSILEKYFKEGRKWITVKTTKK